MHIMTKDGWKQLSPKDFTPAPKPIANNGVPTAYVGQFPSADLCAYVNRVKDNDLKFFDDGIRMVYGKADKRVPTDNADPANPIHNPPPGFW